jgi:hypothetical protein
MDLAVIYQCGNQYESTVEVARKFREHYPSVPMLMINDGGDAILKSVADLYHADYAQCSKTSCDDSGFVFSDAYSANKYVERILAGVPGDDCFVLLLEDDVRIFAQVPLTDLQYDLSGGHSGLYLSPALAGVVKKYRTDLAGRRRICYAYSGGSFMRSSFMNRMRDGGNWKTYVDELFIAQSRITSSELLSSLVLIAGGTLGPYAGYYEPSFLIYKFKKKFSITSGIKMVGQEKSLFKKK